MNTRSLTWKTTLRFAVLVSLTTAMVLLVGARLLDRQMRRGLELLHQGEARELIGMLDGAAPTAEAVKARVARDSEGDANWFFIQIHDDAGNLLFRSVNLGSTILPDLSPEAEPPIRDLRLPGVGQILLSEIRDEGWHVQVASPLTAEMLLIEDYLQVGLMLLLTATLAALGLGYAFSRLTLKPVRQIAAAAERISGENLRERIPISDTRDELANLARILNRTFDGLETSFEQVRRFSADASHELKTPLAIMRLNAEKLRRRLESDPSATAGVDELLEAMDRMQTVIDRLLFLARAEGGGLRSDLQPVALKDFVAEFTEDATVLLEDVGATFTVAACDEGRVRADRGLLRQLLLNLVSNAAKASPPGGVVTFEARAAGEVWLITVTDEGPGLPADKLDLIFERFTRFDTAGESALRPTGHGLGLAICKSIAHLHGGRIRASARPDGRPGLRVTLELPR